MKRIYSNIGVVGLIVLMACKPSEDFRVSQSEVVNTFNEAWNTGNLDLLDQTVHPNYFKLEGDMEINGVAELKSYVANFRNSLEGAKVSYLEEVHDKAKVAVRFTLEGTPSDTKKPFKAAGMVFFRLEDDLIIEDYGVFDQLDALKQQGYKISLTDSETDGDGTN